MRSHKAFFALGFVVLIGAGLLLVGCSDDELPTGGTITIDPQYSSVLVEVDKVIDSAQTLFAHGLDIFVESRGHTTDEEGQGRFEAYLSGNTDSLAMSEDWYIMYDFDIQASSTNLRSDSLLFLQGGASVPMAWEADGMVFTRNWELAHYQTTESYGDYTVRSDFDFTGLNTDQATINGTVELEGHIQIVGDQSTTQNDYTITADFDQLTLSETLGEWGTGRPSSGTYTVSVVCAHSVDGGEPEVSNWQIEGSFTDGVLNSTISDGTVAQNYTRDLNQ